MNKKKFRLTLRSRERIHGIIFILPWLIGLVMFFIYNTAQTINYSFNKITLRAEGGYDMVFTGIANFRFAFLEHGSYPRDLLESLTNMLIDVPLIIFFSLFIALILNRKFALRGVVRAIFFLPVIMETAAVTSALSSATLVLNGGISNIPAEFAGTSGLNLTGMMMLLGNYGVPMEMINYVSSAASRIYEIIRSSGVQIVIFIAALQSISPAMYEVAHIEGATPYETFWKITLPMISPLIITNVVYTIVKMYAASPIVTLAYDTAFVALNYGLSAAMSLVSSLSTCFILLVVGFILTKISFYQN